MMDLKQVMLDATNIAIESQRAGYDIGRQESAAKIRVLTEALCLAEKARIELAQLVEHPDDPDFSVACPNIADSTCVHKAYINLQYARAALKKAKA